MGGCNQPCWKKSHLHIGGLVGCDVQAVRKIMESSASYKVWLSSCYRLGRCLQETGSRNHGGQKQPLSVLPMSVCSIDEPFAGLGGKITEAKMKKIVRDNE